MKNKIVVQVLALIVLVSVFLLPVLLITNFAYLNGDDFCRAGVPLTEFWANLKIWYTGISGRYFNYLVSYLPIYKLTTYRLLLGVLFLSLGGSLYFLTAKIFKYYGIKGNFLNQSITSSLVYIALIAQLPTLFEYFFWYAASSVYLLSTIFFCFILGFLFDINKISKLQFSLLLVLIFCLNGNNEMFILLNSFIFVLSFLVLSHKKKNIYFRLLGANIVCWLSGLIVILSPASGLRQTYYPNGGNVEGSILHAVLSSGMFFFKKLVHFPTILFYGGLFMMFFYFARDNAQEKRAIHPLVALVISMIAIAVVMVVPYYSTGSLNVNAGRIGDMVQVIFNILFTLNLLNAAVFIQESVPRLVTRGAETISVFCMGIYLILLVFLNPNYSMMYKDYKSGSYARYKAEVKKRLDNFQNGADKNLILHKIKSPLILKHWEVSPDPEHWSNTCYKDYLRKTYLLKVDSLIIRDN